MADYYTQFSIAISNTDESITWLATLLTEPDKHDDAMKAIMAEIGFADPDAPFYDLTVMRGQGEYANTLYIYTEESFDMDAFAVAVQGWLRHFKIPHAVYFTWAGTCSRPKTDAYTGGGCIIYHDSIMWMDARSWITENLRKEA